jgi:3-oxoacyl-[acyl-carrier protein] reductase
MHYDFSGKNVIVTGAAAGIGRGVALGFAQSNARVVACDTDARGLDTLAAEAGSDASFVTARADVTSSAAVKRVVRLAMADQERIDVLVNAVGGFSAILGYREITDESWQSSITLNVTSVFYCCREVLPHMGMGGRIINVSSATGRMPTAITSASYAAGKAAVIGLSRHIAREVAPAGITVNCVAPGTTLTPRLAAMYDAERVAGISALTPIGRIAEVRDQVGPILFLASAAAGYITGTTIDVNGGKVMT